MNLDEENRLIAVTKGTHRSEFVYDGLGRRVQILEKELAPDQSTTTSSDRKFLWAGTEIAEERSGDDGGTVQKRFFAQGFVDSDGTILLYTRDHLGSIRELVDMSQTVRARYDYDPYGNVTKVSGDRDSDFLYTGHYWHSQSGLFLTLFRAYDPELGRWLSRDPIEEDGGLNMYSYVLNSPTNLVDPLGLIDLNLVDPNSSSKNWTLWNYYNDMSSPAGVFVVGAHGARGDYDNLYTGSGQVAIKDLVKKIKNSKRWRPGMPIRILACWAGNSDFDPQTNAFPDPLAQKIANELNTIVEAAEGKGMVNGNDIDLDISFFRPPNFNSDIGMNIFFPKGSSGFMVPFGAGGSRWR